MNGTKKLMMSVLVGCVLFCANQAFSNSVTFELIPASGYLEGRPGEELIWNYRVINNETLYWADFTGLTSDPWQFGDVEDLFDYPILAPGEEITGSVYKLVWDLDAPNGFVNSRSFVFDIDWYDEDPYGSGNYVESDQISVDFSAKVAAIPEPSSMILFAFGIISLIKKIRNN